MCIRRRRGRAGFPVENIALFVGAHMHPIESHLPILDGAKGILQVDIPHPNGFDFCPRQLDARLIFILHKIIMESFPVPSNLLSALSSQNGHLLSAPQNSGDGRCLLSFILPCLSSAQTDLPLCSNIVYRMKFDKAGQMCYNLVTFVLGSVCPSPGPPGNRQGGFPILCDDGGFYGKRKDPRCIKVIPCAGRTI